MTGQNKSHAVMAQREGGNGKALDYFPTPPWATRALMEHVIPSSIPKIGICLEPACGSGNMVQPLTEYFHQVIAEDIANYGWVGMDAQRDFLDVPGPERAFDWIITNPPFNKAEEFALRAMDIASHGVAIFARTAFLEGKGRYERLFKSRPPFVAVFSERVPLVKGRLDRKASTATSYSWFVWRRDERGAGQYTVIPPCRAQLERDFDYG